MCFPGAAQHEVVRCRPGIVTYSEFFTIPGLAVHRFALHRIRETSAEWFASAVHHRQARHGFGRRLRRHQRPPRVRRVEPALVGNEAEFVGDADDRLGGTQQEIAIAFGEHAQCDRARRSWWADRNISTLRQNTTSNSPRWEKSDSRLSCRNPTIERISGAICHRSPIWVKDLISSPIGSPRCTSNGVDALFAFSSTSVEMSVATISMRHPASAPIPLRLMASGTAPARSRRPRTRCGCGAIRTGRAISAGMMVCGNVRTGSCRGRRTIVGRHRFDDGGPQRAASAERSAHQLRKAEQAGLARDRQQPALDQVVLVGGQHEAGAFLQQLRRKS